MKKSLSHQGLIYAIVVHMQQIRPQGYKSFFFFHFSYLTQQSMKFILYFDNFKSSLRVHVHTTFECFKAKQFINFEYFSLYEQLKFHAQMS